MPKDMCVPCGGGLINVRVGAVIMKDGKFLMVGNKAHPEYLYSVGGRIKFGETARDAVKREVLEETGAEMEIERLSFVHELYFYGDSPSNLGRPIYEISFYFYMKVPEDFAPSCRSFTDGGSEEYLTWASPSDPVRIYPEFFRTELLHPEEGVKHFVTDERGAKSNNKKRLPVSRQALLSMRQYLLECTPKFSADGKKGFISSQKSRFVTSRKSPEPRFLSLSAESFIEALRWSALVPS